MEFSKVSDECSSSESGWTTYLASPIHDDSNYEIRNDEDQIGTHRQPKIDENEDKSDDSMTSDASSGPSHIEVSYGKTKKNHIFGQNGNKLFSGKKHSEQAEKGEKFGVEKEVTRGAIAYAPTCYSKTAAKNRRWNVINRKNLG